MDRSRSGKAKSRWQPEARSSASGTKSLREYEDYNEGKMWEKGSVFIGTTEALGRHRNDVDIHHKESAYYGRILRPEAREQGEWTYEANQAFFLGVIESRREVTLLSDLADDPYEQLCWGYTCDELFWLQDNRYTFAPNPANPLQTIATPPPIPQPLVEPRHFDKKKNPCISRETRQRMFLKIKEAILASRPNTELTGSQSSSTPSDPPRPS